MLRLQQRRQRYENALLRDSSCSRMFLSFHYAIATSSAVLHVSQEAQRREAEAAALRERQRLEEEAIRAKKRAVSSTPSLFAD